jgi:HSP20 family molecular chaperone IbpA
MQSLNQEGNEKIQAQRDKLTKRYQLEGQEFLKQKTAQDVMNKNQRLQTNMRHQQEMSKMSESQSLSFKNRDQEYRKGFKEQDVFFEKKYADQYQRHNESMKALETKNKNVIEDLKTTLTREISKKASLQDDPFYKFESIKPQILENKDSVEIRVQIPEYAKKDLLLTTNGKEVVISFNRRFTDANKLSDGSINKVNKVETFTSRIPTNLNLDPKSIKSSFEDGVMTYIVRKA